MCLGTPATIVSIDADRAIVDARGVARSVSLLRLDDVALGGPAPVAPGDAVLIAAGFVIRRLEPDEISAASLNPPVLAPTGGPK